MAESIIRIENLSKYYEETTAVDQLSLKIEKGEIFGLLGPNGAGKSTTILMLLGLSEPNSGKVEVCGLNATKQPIEVKKRVGYLPDDIGFYDDRTGYDNLLYTAYLNGVSRSEAANRATELLQRVGLHDAMNSEVKTYSRGMRQRLGLADVLIKDPEVIILDEPTLGIDPEGVRDFLKLIKQLSRDEGLTVLLSSHHLHQVQQICDRVGLFVKGRLLAVGQIEELAHKLFDEEAIIIKVGVDDFTETLSESLSQFEDIQSIDIENSQRFTLYCRKDITSKVAKWLIENNLSIEFIHKQNYGLDEIYHRYFEGGDVNDKPLQSSK